MVKKSILLLWLVTELFFGSRMKSGAQQEDASRLHVNVVLVQLNVAVTDRKGNYVSGLKPEDFIITEDKIPEKIATFEEGNEPTRSLSGGVTSASGGKPADAPGMGGDDPARPLLTRVNGANIFILFDTSNYMYRGFVFAQDAIADFVRSLEGVSQVALYSYSRDLSRVVTLTPNREAVLRGVRATVAGDDAALYNCLLLTVKDAAHYTGRKVVVVFSNGPDNSSMVPPEDVAELAQSSGIAIYMISTQLARIEPVSTAVFERMTAATGGKAYFAKNWKDEQRAFASIRDDLAHLYSLSYYPQTNPNRGWRGINVKLVGDRLKKYHIRTRNGYRPQPKRFTGGTATASASEAAPSNQ